MPFDLNRLGKPPSAMSETEFVAAFGGIYEHSPWVARRTRERGLDHREDTIEGLAEALAATVDAANDEANLALIRAHPDLAGRAAVRGELGEASSREQTGAGTTSAAPRNTNAFSSSTRPT